jgi:TetR/AcrR family transcriptional regulator, cholesterol catabolism regulator
MSSKTSRNSVPSPDWQEQHDKILSVAEYLFWQKGYLGTSIQDIADKAGVNKSNIYYYFKNKEMLLYRIIVKIHEDVMKFALSVADSDLPPTEKLEKLIYEHVKWSLSNLVLGQLDIHDRRNLSQNLLKEIIQLRDQYDSIFRKTISDVMLQNESLFGDAKLASLFILGMVNSMSLWYRPNAGLSADDIAAAVCRFVFSGLQLQSARSGLSSLE